jgi:ribosomal protein S18 acetylase RimI-like enzyme
MIDTAQIRGLEERGLNAWPALQTVLFGGWAFRLSGGFTKRANSINALNPAAPFSQVREAAEHLYARHELPAVFRLSPLAGEDADRDLALAGYAMFDPSLVLTAPIGATETGSGVDIEEFPSETWLQGFAAANSIEAAQRPIHDRMVTSIALPAAFATLRENGQGFGFGLAVLEGGLVGLFDIVIAPSHRGRGNGRRLTEALLQWGHRSGAATAYLQVREENEAARKLYAGLGFGEAYRYHYRVPKTYESITPPQGPGKAPTAARHSARIRLPGRQT